MKPLLQASRSLPRFEHRCSGDIIGHLFRKYARFFGSVAPMLRIIERVGFRHRSLRHQTSGLLESVETKDQTDQSTKYGYFHQRLLGLPQGARRKKSVG
jgi:hypothetical protein